MVGVVTLSQPAGGENSPTNGPTAIKTQIHQKSPHKLHKAHSKSIHPTSQGDCATEPQKIPTTEATPQGQGVRPDQFNT